MWYNILDVQSLKLVIAALYSQRQTIMTLQGKTSKEQHDAEIPTRFPL